MTEESINIPISQSNMINSRSKGSVIKLIGIESFNTKDYWKEFKIDKTYQNISLSDLEIKKRHINIIKIFKVLEDEKEIESKIWIYSILDRN